MPCRQRRGDIARRLILKCLLRPGFDEQRRQIAPIDADLPQNRIDFNEIGLPHHHLCPGAIKPELNAYP